MSKTQKYFGYHIILILFFTLSVNGLNADNLSKKIKWGYYAIVFIDSDKVIAEDRYGNIIMKGTAGIDDAKVIQFAIDLAVPTGHLIITNGRYYLNKSLLICNNIKITGEGRGTTIIPPIDDYAFKIEKGEKEIFPRPYHEPLNPLYAVIIRDLTIDGELENLPKSGKGLFLKDFWNSSFENLWIQNTGNAISLIRMRESDFTSIYLINNGDEEKKEPGVFIEEGNNLHFRGLHVVYQNYIGLEMLRGKLVFITQSFFHGWLKPHIPAKYPEIQIVDSNIDRFNEGRFKSDIIIENSRITVGGEGSSVVNIINSPVTIRQCIATAGIGKTVISATKNARVNISDNSFYSLLPLPSGKYVLYAEDSEVMFKNNVVSSKNLQVYLKAVRNSIIADNRFDAISEEPNIYIADNGSQGSRCIQVRGNIFRKENLKDAVKIAPNSTEDIFIHENLGWSE